MAVNEAFKEFVLDQLDGIGEFETKRMFGGVALIKDGSAFGKIKHDKFWLKVGDQNREQFVQGGMQQYTYGKEKSRKLNFYATPIDILEDRDKLKTWVLQSIEITLKD